MMKVPIGILTAVLFASSAQAQSIIKQVFTDPTTYAPAGVYFVADWMDWQSSQPLFQHGSVESNPEYTVSGKTRTAPISEAAGDRKVLRDTAEVFAEAIALDASERVIEARLPHTKSWKIVGFISRVALASVLTYGESSKHFVQWRQNVAFACAHGY